MKNEVTVYVIPHQQSGGHTGKINQGPRLDNDDIKQPIFRIRCGGDHEAARRRAAIGHDNIQCRDPPLYGQRDSNALLRLR